jgi:hypothetical protein
MPVALCCRGDARQVRNAVEKSRTTRAPEPAHGLFSLESEMTLPAITATRDWWAGRARIDAVACEIVGPGGIADLVGVRFDQQAIDDRRGSGIEPVIDALALQMVMATRRRAMTTRQLADLFHVSRSGARWAIRIAIGRGAMIDTGGLVRAHPDWRPAAQRLVAVELKLHDWRRALSQASTYQSWANAAWIVLARSPGPQAITAVREAGIGLGCLTDDRVRVLARPRNRERLRQGDWTSVWAGEQVLAEVKAGTAEIVAS